MTKRKPKDHEIFASLIHGQHLRTDYKKFLAEEGLEDEYASADRFAIRATGGGARKAYDLTEREIIIKLAGKIDPMYD